MDQRRGILKKWIIASFFIFFYELQFQKPGCGCQSDSIHGVRPESSLGYLFMASGMLYVHINAKALKLLAIQRGFILEQNIWRNTN